MTNFFVEPPRGLLDKILNRIHREERFLVLRRIVIFSVTFVASLEGFVPAAKMLLSDFNQSGFVSFFSLMFSDFSTVLSSWQSFSMILLETLPAASIALLLFVLLIFFQSIKYLSKNIKIIRSHNLLAN